MATACRITKLTLYGQKSLTVSPSVIPELTQLGIVVRTKKPGVFELAKNVDELTLWTYLRKPEEW
jgi:hypothetical protein